MIRILVGRDVAHSPKRMRGIRDPRRAFQSAHLATSSIHLIVPQALLPAPGILAETLTFCPLPQLHHGRNIQSSTVWMIVTLLSSLLKLSRADEMEGNTATIESAEVINTIATRQPRDPAIPTMSTIPTLTQLRCTVRRSHHGGDHAKVALTEASGQPV